MHCCTLVLGFHHCIVDGEAVMHFLAWSVYRRVGRFVSQCLSPWKKHPVYKPLAECMSRMSGHEWVQWEADYWGQPVTTQSSPACGAIAFAQMNPVDPEHRTTGVLTMVTAAKTTKRFIASCKNHQCTVQAAVQTVLGSVLAALMTRGTLLSSIPLSTQVTINLRPFLVHCGILTDAQGSYCIHGL